MFITNKNECSFNVIFNAKRNLKIWNLGEDVSSFVSPFIQEFRKIYHDYFWYRFLNDSVRYNGYYKFNRIEHKSFNFNDGFLWKEDNDDNNDGQKSMEVDDRGEDYIVNERKYILKTLDDMKIYYEFIIFIYRLLKSEGNRFESFQKSMLYEILFFYISKHESCNLLNKFMAAMYPYFCFIDTEYTRKLYTNKHYVLIVPRRHGKSRNYIKIATAIMCCLKKINMLYIAQSKSMCMETRNEIIANVEKSIVNNSDVREVSKPNDGLVITYKEGYQNVIKFTSAHRDGSLRGWNPEICVVDEALAIGPSKFSTIMAVAQRECCKIGIMSSPVANNKEILRQLIINLSVNDESEEIVDGSSIVNRKEVNDINLYRVGYFCTNSDHLRYSTTQNGCVNMLFYMPNHINFSDSNKTLTRIMCMDEVCYENELGIIRSDDILRNGCSEHKFGGNGFGSSIGIGNGGEDEYVFKSRFIDFIKSSASFIDIKSQKQTNAAFIYLDPAVNCTLSSGIGLACVMGKYNLQNDTCPVVMYMDHKHATELPITNTVCTMIIKCISHVTSLFPRVFFFLAIENNSIQSCVADMYIKLSDEFVADSYNMGGIAFYYTPASTIYQNPNNNCNNTNKRKLEKIPGYALYNVKRAIFSKMIAACNNCNVRFSTHMGTFFIHENNKNTYVMDYFINQLMRFRINSRKRSFEGKIKHLPEASIYGGDRTDDLVVAVIMATSMANWYTEQADKWIASPRSMPTHWVNILTKR